MQTSGAATSANASTLYKDAVGPPTSVKHRSARLTIDSVARCDESPPDADQGKAQRSVQGRDVWAGAKPGDETPAERRERRRREWDEAAARRREVTNYLEETQKRISAIS